MDTNHSEFEPYSKLFKKTNQSSRTLPEFNSEWMNQHPQNIVEIRQMRTNKQPIFLAIAATLLIGLGVYFFGFFQKPVENLNQTTESTEPTEKKETSKELKAIVLFVKGKATKSDGTRLFQGNVLKKGDNIITEAKSSIDIGLTDSSVIRISEKSSIVLETLQNSASGFEFNFKINAGKLFNIAPKLTKNSSYKVSTPTAVAGVRGTSFEVSYNKRKTIVYISEGSVEVISLINNKKEFVASKNNKVVISEEEETLYEDQEELSGNNYNEMLEHLKSIDSETINTVQNTKTAKNEDELSKIYNQSIEILTLSEGREIRGVVISQKNGKMIVQTMKGTFVIEETEVKSIRYP